MAQVGRCRKERSPPMAFCPPPPSFPAFAGNATSPWRGRIRRGAGLWEMLDRVAEDGDPGVLAFLVDRVMRWRELGVGEGAERDGGDAG
ncbi:hypothetical protein DFR49_1479 [Hephaestia caeni]|uniref:Uncharacterized protein n=1 Tax=Hephaestia caeni TaxID=645617 RepID=A0A397PID2_9SPHN|nr:hypothetical protein DFR49_1479 [Hephaestia caeni]